MPEFFTRDHQRPISSKKLHDVDRATQVDAMESWFRERYKTLAERKPYCSAEAGGKWSAGAFDVRGELNTEFSGNVPDDLIDEVIGGFEEDFWRAPSPSREGHGEHLVAEMACITGYYQYFAGAVLDIEKLRQTEVDRGVATCFYRMLYVNVITALATYLSDAFISTVLSSPGLMRRFVETRLEFRSGKVAFADAFKTLEDVERMARACLAGRVWNHLPRVSQMYRDSLGIEFPAETGTVFRAVLKCHDIVHRNGKTKDGTEVLVSSEDIAKLIQAVEELVQDIDVQLVDVRELCSTGSAPSHLGIAS